MKSVVPASVKSVVPASVKSVVPYLLVLLLAACGPGGNSFRVKGRFRDMQQGEFYIYNLSDTRARLDTLTLQEGKFLYKGQTDAVTPYVLVFPNGMEQVIFVGPGEDLEYEATANDLKNYVVNGSETNQLMNKFRQETYTLNPSATRGVARAYIKDNPLSPAALYLLDRYFVGDDDASPAETAELLQVLKPKHPHNHYLLDIEKKMTLARHRDNGQTLPDVTLVRPDHTRTRLWATPPAPFNLILCWALWHPNGYDHLWRARRIAEKYGAAGNLRIIAISLDVEPHRWQEAARQDSLTLIEHYCDGQGLESPVAKTLGIGSLPFYLLTDQHKKVLDSGTEAAKMEEMLKKHLSEP